MLRSARSCLSFMFLLMLLLPEHGIAHLRSVVLYPANGATNINPDTHLVLHFAGVPTIGNRGRIRIYEASEHRLVDTLDMSIPAGPDPTRHPSPVQTPGIPLAPSIPTSPTTTTPAVRFTPADLHNFQLTTIGGLEDFHFYPVIVHGNTATVYPHSHTLRYGHRYIVQVDPGVLSVSGTAFAGISTDKEWTFTTKMNPPPAGGAQVIVAADGSGDFNTVQGAIDFAPDHPAHRFTVFIKDGTYEEIVFFRQKSNLTIRGEDRDKVQVGYANNSAFNPPQPGPNRRCAFSVYDSDHIRLENFSVSNYAYGQAEGLLIFGSKNIVRNVNITGSGDALNLRGSVYLESTHIIGDGDTILGVGPAFFRHCEIQSSGPFMWIRNTEANHGNVFVDCTFIARDRHPASHAREPSQSGAPVAVDHPSAVLARLPNNHGLNYPYAEAVLINCKLEGIPAQGWGPIDVDPSHVHLWEFNSTTPDGRAVDIARRHPASRQLKIPQDSGTISAYLQPSFVLEGWDPESEL